TNVGSLSIVEYTNLIFLGSILYFLINSIISTNLSGLCTIYILPLSFNKYFVAFIKSSKFALTSCLEINLYSFSLVFPVSNFLYGGLVTTKSNFSLSNKAFSAISFTFKFFISILSCNEFNSTLLFAISAISF